MLKTRIIPVLLLNNWNLVKSIQFGDMRTIGNPVQHVKVFNSRNVDELALLDIGAARNRAEPPYEIIADLARECFMPLSVGGGITSIEMIKRTLLAGADKTIINTYAHEHPEFITESSRVFGSQCIMVSVDVKKNKGTYSVFLRGGTLDTGMDPVTWVKEVEARGAGEILLTSIDRDGMMVGFDLDIIKKVSEAVNIPVIVSGGAGSTKDFVDAFKSGADALGAASIFLYTQTTPTNVKHYMKEHGIETRI